MGSKYSVNILVESSLQFNFNEFITKGNGQFIFGSLNKQSIYPLPSSYNYVQINRVVEKIISG